MFDIVFDETDLSTHNHVWSREQIARELFTGKWEYYGINKYFLVFKSNMRLLFVSKTEKEG